MWISEILSDYKYLAK